MIEGIKAPVEKNFEYKINTHETRHGSSRFNRTVISMTSSIEYQ